MTNTPFTPGIAPARLGAQDLAENFSDLHPPLDRHEALVAADRCYFCHDAPCITACPTAIDIPLFIRQIATGTTASAAQTIFEQNILGGMCARVCPTETLCEEACVRETAEGKPVLIGQLQRFATDSLMAADGHPFERAAPSGKRVAVVGAGPAGLACAHRLALHGHDVEIFEARPKAGGLNEYGIASYKSTNGFAAAEVSWLLKIGGITLFTDKALGRDITLEGLRGDYDAVFLGMGLTGVNALRAEGEARDGVADAVEFIADLRQADDLGALPVGRNVVVIGGGMTAIDAAVQSKLLGAENVTLVYRRDRDAMPASRYEQDLATSRGVRFIFNAMPLEVLGPLEVPGPLEVLGNGAATALRCEYTKAEGRSLSGTGETFDLPADQVLKAIGQTLEGAPEAVRLEAGKIAVTGAGRTSADNVWAGGDCASGGEDLTVTAVAEGRDAAEDIHATLIGGAG